MIARECTQVKADEANMLASVVELHAHVVTNVWNAFAVDTDTVYIYA